MGRHPRAFRCGVEKQRFRVDEILHFSSSRSTRVRQRYPGTSRPQNRGHRRRLVQTSQFGGALTNIQPHLDPTTCHATKRKNDQETRKKQEALGSFGGQLVPARLQRAHHNLSNPVHDPVSTSDDIVYTEQEEVPVSANIRPSAPPSFGTRHGKITVLVKSLPQTSRSFCNGHRTQATHATNSHKSRVQGHADHVIRTALRHSPSIRQSKRHLKQQKRKQKKQHDQHFLPPFHAPKSPAGVVAHLPATSPVLAKCNHRRVPGGHCQVGKRAGGGPFRNKMAHPAVLIRRTISKRIKDYWTQSATIRLTSGSLLLTAICDNDIDNRGRQAAETKRHCSSMLVVHQL